MQLQILYFVLVGHRLPAASQSVLVFLRASWRTSQPAPAPVPPRSFLAAWQMEVPLPLTSPLPLSCHPQVKVAPVEGAHYPLLHPARHLLHLHFHHLQLSQTSLCLSIPPFQSFTWAPECLVSGDWLSDVGEVGATGVVLLPAVWVFESAGGRGHHSTH